MNPRSTDYEADALTTAPSRRFQKARWDDFVFYFDSHYPSAEEYSSLCLSSATAHFTSLTLNEAKSSIPFGHIKPPPKAWWSAEVQEVVSERRKAFAAAHRSNEDRKAYISASDVLWLSSPRPRLRHGRRLAFLSRPNLTLNLYIPLFVLLLVLLPPLLTSSTVPLPRNRLWSTLLT